MGVDLLAEDGLLDLRPRAGPGAKAPKGSGDANRDLVEWASAGRRPEEAAPGPAASALCHVCGTRPGRRDCRGCARPMCASDSWFMFGLCTACASEERVRRWHGGGDVEGGNWLKEGRP